MARLQIHTGLPDVSLDVIIPEFMKNKKAREQGLSRQAYYASRNLPVLWLLHGGLGDSSDWPRYTRIELYAEEKGLIVVCPTGNNGCFVNMVQGNNWEDVITEKLWEFVHSMFPTSDLPEDNYIAGLSMGGYGALRIGLQHPERYSRIGAFSSGIGIPQEYAVGEFRIPGADVIFGDPDQILGSKYDGFQAAKDRAAAGGPLPPVYISCGTKDRLYGVNAEFRDHLISLGYDVVWDEGPYGHEWRFWDEQVEKFIKTLP